MTSSSTPSEEGYKSDRLAQAIGDISAALNSTLELDDVLNLILDRAANVVPYPAGTVLLIQDDRAVVMGQRGYDESMIGVQLALTTLTRGLIDTSEPLVIHDTREAPDWVVTEESKDIRSAAIVPIHSDGRVIGFISLDSNEVGSFTLDQARQLQIFADQAGNAIRNARLYKETREALAAIREQQRLTRVLGDISAELTAQSDIDDLLDFILQRISRFVTGVSVSILLISDGVADVVRTTPGDEKLLGTKLVVAETNSLREAAATRLPHLIDDTLALGS